MSGGGGGGERKGKAVAPFLYANPKISCEVIKEKKDQK